MNWGPWLAIGYTSAFFSICIPVGAVAYWQWRSGKKTPAIAPALFRQAAFKAAVAWACLSDFVAEYLGYTSSFSKPVYSLGFVIAWQSRLILAITSVRLLMFVLDSSDQETVFRALLGLLRMWGRRIRMIFRRKS